MGTLRKWVQALFFFLSNGYWAFPFTRTIYQGPLKVICAPGLNCYSCPAATTACPIGAIQQLLGGIRLTLETGQFYVGLYVTGALGIIGATFGRMVCGWACPFGLFQELLHKVPSPKFRIWKNLRAVKYGLLVSTVVLLPLFAVNDFGSGSPWFCKYICPAGTLEAGLPMLLMQPALRDTLGVLFAVKAVILLGFTVWAVFSSRPFCRTACPLGAFYALFSRVRLVQLRVNGSRCNGCNACAQACPVDVNISQSPRHPECILCLSCMTTCKSGAVDLEIGGIPFRGASVSCRKKIGPASPPP
ncbi:MAG TPA: (4Fe-4S)-binding protein [Desulfobacteraceae bacterium]|nr:(4Fe-4S)-binding protein [Desulfobacteraceae bacterium]